MLKLIHPKRELPLFQADNDKTNPLPQQGQVLSELLQIPFYYRSLGRLGLSANLCFAGLFWRSCPACHSFPIKIHKTIVGDRIASLPH